jgi:hypothetical protein
LEALLIASAASAALRLIPPPFFVFGEILSHLLAAIAATRDNFANFSLDKRMKLNALHRMILDELTSGKSKIQVHNSNTHSGGTRPCS